MYLTGQGSQLVVPITHQLKYADTGKYSVQFSEDVPASVLLLSLERNE